MLSSLDLDRGRGAAGVVSRTGERLRVEQTRGASGAMPPRAASLNREPRAVPRAPREARRKVRRPQELEIAGPGTGRSILEFIDRRSFGSPSSNFWTLAGTVIARGSPALEEVAGAVENLPDSFGR